MTKILFLEDKIENPGGGVIALQTMSEKLSRDYNTEILWVDDQDKKDTIKFFSRKISKLAPLEVGRLGYFLEPKFNKKTNEKIAEVNPDIIFAQRRTGEIALQYAKNKDVKVVLLLHDFELLYDPKVTHKGSKIISKMINKLLRPINKKAAQKILEKVDFIIFNSKFTAQNYNVPDKSAVIPPFIDTEKYKVSTTGEKILHVNASKEKGIGMTLEVAEKMSDREFLIILSSKKVQEEVMEKIRSLENVKYEEYFEDMRNAYKKTKIVLIPSNIEETFGRIPIEAGVSGIPAISSGNGGLTDSTLQELIVPEKEPIIYINKIRQVEENYERFQQLSKEKAEKFDYRKNYDELKEIIESLNNS